MMKLRNKYQGFMRGRYGYFDNLNKLLLSLAVIISLLSAFFHWRIGSLISLICLIVIYWRFFSKKIYHRSNENQRYVKFIQRWQKKYSRLKQRKDYRFFTCPNCQQELRAPKGRGRIRVTCSACHHQFERTV